MYWACLTEGGPYLTGPNKNSKLLYINILLIIATMSRGNVIIHRISSATFLLHCLSSPPNSPKYTLCFQISSRAPHMSWGMHIMNSHHMRRLALFSNLFNLGMMHLSTSSSHEATNEDTRFTNILKGQVFGRNKGRIKRSFMSLGSIASRKKLTLRGHSI